jgi:uncharacterized OB-fold protein
MSTSHDQLPDKPRPQPAPENQPYWDGLRAHKLLVQRCTACHKLRHYPRPVCDSCYAMDYDWSQLSGRGTVHSWTISHHPFHPGFKRETPYITVTVDLAEGVRLQGVLEGGDGDPLAVGKAVVVDYIDVDADLSLPYFRFVA